MEKLGLVKSLNDTIFKKKPISEDELTMDLLENILDKYRKKYDVQLGYILSTDVDKCKYSLMFKDSKGKHITTIYSESIFKGLVNSILALYEIYRRDKKDA